MQFKFSHGEPRARSLCNLSWEKSPFSRKFKDSHNTGDFLTVWEREVLPHLNTNTGAYVSEAATALTCEIILPPKSKKMKEDTETMNESMDKKIEASYSGKFHA